MASVLVVDDDAQVRAFVRVVLESGGHEVREATNGAEGITAHRQRPADLILCDIFMPEKEGLETIRELHGLFPQVKIVAMSGGSPRAGPGDFLALAKAFGAAATLDKPIRAKALLEAVKEVLQS
jgi:CheY-like chemotaxis protein